VNIRSLLGSVVVREETRISCLQLKVTAGVQMLKSLGKELVVVGDAALELTAVDEVKGSRVGPFGFKVVDLEETVRRGPVVR
jgi:hypothetical protein